MQKIELKLPRVEGIFELPLKFTYLALHLTSLANLLQFFFKKKAIGILKLAYSYHESIK